MTTEPVQPVQPVEPVVDGEPEERVDAVFAALADPTRRRLLDDLSSGGPRSATDLAKGYAMTRQAVVKHLGTLSEAGLLRPERNGREVCYRVVGDGLGDATSWLATVGARWDARLAALQRHLVATPQPAPRLMAGPGTPNCD